VSAVRSSQTSRLTGTYGAPGDKSVSHRALMLSALCIGESRITGLLEGEDVLATASAMRAMGATIDRQDDGTWTVRGVGVGGLSQPASALDMGNSGTAVRLLMGLVASYPIDVQFTGDASLCSRPMGRIIDPLGPIGTVVDAAEGNTLPLTVHGTGSPLPTEYEVPVPSAQVKSAVLLAGLNTPGITTVVEAEATRDHTENMLRAMGANLSVSDREGGGRRITLAGPAELRALDIVVPGDPSSAAFLIVAALTTPGSDVTVTNVGTNPLRTGLFQTLREMGAALTLLNERIEGGEAVADIQVSYTPLTGVVVPADRAPRMIDEYPILAIAAAAAQGDTLMQGLAELRVKESDRLAAIAEGLSANGVAVESGDDWLKVTGTGGNIPGGGTVATHYDHRIAMAFLVMGCSANSPIVIDEDDMIATSFPTFLAMMGQAGADIAEVNP
jgi:3-phosphoshikimate 1-carboxyvinyltransferase